MLPLHELAGAPLRQARRAQQQQQGEQGGGAQHRPGEHRGQEEDEEVEPGAEDGGRVPTLQGNNLSFLICLPF